MYIRLLKIIALFACCLGFYWPAEARIRVVDGDSLFIGNREVRLSGIDAPEYHQTCQNMNGEEYACGKKAREFLEKSVGADIKCRTLMRDKYKRDVAICTSNGVDLNEKMVRSGWAVAYKRYTDAYNEAEQEAKKHKRGIWQGKFMRPELYRILNKRYGKKR